MKLPTFSFSKYDAHSGSFGCPLKMKFRMIDYLCAKCFKGPVGRNDTVCPHCLCPIVKAPALVKGGDFAKNIEVYLKTGEGFQALFPTLGSNSAEVAIQKIRAAYVENPASVLIEHEFLFAMDKHMLKGAPDVVILDHDEKTAQVIDWKTGSVGKRKGLKAGSMAKYDEQLELYAMVVMILFPWVTEVSTSIYFVEAIDVGRIDRRSYTRSDLPALTMKWGRLADKVMGDKALSPKQGFWCNWCEFHKALGGPCPVDQQEPKKKENTND